MSESHGEDSRLPKILEAARIGAASYWVGDPAISKEDVHQEICLYLLERPDIDGIELMVWIATKRMRDRVKPAHVVRRLRQAELGDIDMEKPNEQSILDQIISDEMAESVKLCSLPRTQRMIIDGLLAGSTPKELCDQHGMSLSSFSGILSRAIQAIRSDAGVESSPSVRLGRCKTAKSSDDSEKSDRACESCDRPFTPKSVASRFCSEKCRWDKGNKVRKERRALRQ